MTVKTGDLQAVVMAGGKGSRMTDITAGMPKCLLPVANFPLVFFPLKMLQNNGFQDAIVIVPDSAKGDVVKIPERFGLTIRLDVVGIPAQEEWGTADSLRHIGDKLSGSDILIVSGDLILDQGVRGVTDLHHLHNSSFTALFSQTMLDPKTVTVPGPASTKYKKEKDLVCLDGDRLCLLTAEADVEEEISVKNKILRQHPRITVRSNLQDAHLYIVKKWVCDYICCDKTVSTIKGEVVPKLVKRQFSKCAKTVAKTAPDDNVQSPPRADILSFVPEEEIAKRVKNLAGQDSDKHSYGCYGYVSSGGQCMRVNSLPAYWDTNRRAGHLAAAGSGQGGLWLLNDGQSLVPVHPSATVGETAQVSECVIGGGSNVSVKTTLSNSVVGSNCVVEEKTTVKNCVIMDNVTIRSGSKIEDCIICDNCIIGPGCQVKMCVLGRAQEVVGGTSHAHQLLLDKDRMMEV